MTTSAITLLAISGVKILMGDMCVIVTKDIDFKDRPPALVSLCTVYIHSFIHSFIRSLTHVRLFIYSLILFFRSFACSLICAFVRSYLLCCVRPFVYSLHRPDRNFII